MAEFVLIVDFEVKPGSIDRFVELIEANALASVANEPGCLQFDVVRQQDEPSRVTLYEVYADETAFAAHRDQPHTKEFFAGAKDVIASQSARRFTRAAANAKG